MLRNWFWRIEEARGGPDYALVLRFEPCDATRLGAMVRAFSLPGFVLDDIVFEELRERNRPALCYLDARTYQSLARQRDSGQRQSTWIYHSISVEGHRFFIERGYSGYLASECDASETNLAAALASSSEITLASWEVRQWGNGAGDRAVAQGSSGPHLLDYLRAPK